MKSLVIVESPTKARTLSRFLGADYRIEATMGHIRDLPENKLGVEINQKSEIRNQRSENALHSLSSGNDQITYDFIPDYQIISGRKGRVAELKKMAGEMEKIILAPDPDREGEAISWHVAALLKGKKTKKDVPVYQRIVFHEITESAIRDALNHPREIDMQLVDSQQARRILDRLVGYKLSPLLWNKLGMRWLSAGRVQSVAVRLIVEREREIKAFRPQEYWMVEVELSKIRDQKSEIRNEKENNHTSFIARLVEIADVKAEVKDKESAEKIVTDLKGATYTVTKVEKKEIRRYPTPPFTTSTLQQAASNKFGWSAKRTMRAAQNLYEEGYITYHRTDSTNLANEAVGMARKYITDILGESYLPAQAKLYKTKSKVAQEAHEAIRPSNVFVLSESDQKKIPTDLRNRFNIHGIDTNIGRDGELLYSLIWRRFLSCQMNEAVFDATAVTISAKIYINDSATAEGFIYILKATGQTMKFDGWLIIYGEVQSSKYPSSLRLLRAGKVQSDNENNKSLREENKELPELSVGELLQLLNILPQQKFTEPPPRYNEASLIKTLEEDGIGRPSTYAPIISTIQDRKYVEKVDKRFYPTDLGGTVTDFLVGHFPDLFAVSFTARMEGELDDIANGTLPWGQVLNDFYIPFNTKLGEVFKSADRVKVDLGTTDEKCSKCGSPMAIRLSKFGKFLACSTFPDCKFTKSIVEKAGIVCPKCGGDIIIKKTRLGKQFYGCENYPKCTLAAWKKEEIK